VNREILDIGIRCRYLSLCDIEVTDACIVYMWYKHFSVSDEWRFGRVYTFKTGRNILFVVGRVQIGGRSPLECL